MKTPIKAHFTILLLFIASICYSQQVDTVSVYSKKMDLHIKNVVILPKDYDFNKEYPVLYLLHGYGGNHTSWINLKPTLPQEATKYNIIIVCPDGKNSWYLDSPINPKSQYETYVSKELVNYIDSAYCTRKNPKGRAITGLSMGGHGGLWLGISHQDIFGACGSTSGGVDIRPFPNNWEMKKTLGKYNENTQTWEKHTVTNLISKINSDSLSIILDCGTEDVFYKVNEELHKKFLDNNIKHDYIIRPGGHNREYWNNSIDYQLLYFSKIFNQYE
ncbi:MAG: alpha/beta hydrolase [Dysgonomonas sp.]